MLPQLELSHVRYHIERTPTMHHQIYLKFWIIFVYHVLNILPAGSEQDYLTVVVFFQIPVLYPSALSLDA